MPRTSFITDGYEQIEKTVKPFGNGGAHIGAPNDWIGCKVAIIRLDELFNVSNEIFPINSDAVFCCNTCTVPCFVFTGSIPPTQCIRSDLDASENAKWEWVERV